MVKFNDFFSRIELIRGKSKIYPFLMDLGLTKGSVNGVINGGKLSSESLALISRAKNVNLNWLVTGDGAPYRVATFADTLSAAAYLRALGDERWHRLTLVVVKHSAISALILQNPGTYTVGGTEYRYTITETIAAPDSHELYTAIHMLRVEERCMVECSASDAAGLVSGMQSPTDFLQAFPAKSGHVMESHGGYAIGKHSVSGKNSKLAARIDALDENQKNRVIGYLDSIDPPV